MILTTTFLFIAMAFLLWSNWQMYKSVEALTSSQEETGKSLLLHNKSLINLTQWSKDHNTILESHGKDIADLHVRTVKLETHNMKF